MNVTEEVQQQDGQVEDEFGIVSDGSSLLPGIVRVSVSLLQIVQVERVPDDHVQS